MSKETGLGANFYLDGYDLSGDTGSLEKISKAMTPIPQTGINKLAVERNAGQLMGGIDWTSFFNPTNAHPPLSLLPRTDRIATYFHRELLGTPAASMVCKQLDYAGTRATDGALTFKVSAISNAWWLDWGLSLTAGIRDDTAATNGLGVDFSAAYNFGLQAYLQVFELTGTDATVKLQQSSDNGAGDAYADVTGGAFTVVTADPTKERIATARNQAVEQWLRVVTTGTFTSISFAVHVTVNRTEYTI
jgi:hypothetical protein